jgi:hypothetical protein
VLSIYENESLALTFFLSGDYSEMHVAHADGEAKFWLTPEITLVSNMGLSAKQLKEAQIIVEVHLKEIFDAWSQHFGG